MKNEKEEKEEIVDSSEMLDVTLSIDVEDLQDGTADLVLSDKSFYCSMTITVKQAQELANHLQRFVDRKCKEKSPELHDSELAAKLAAVDQWNAAQKMIKAAENLMQQAEKLIY